MKQGLFISVEGPEGAGKTTIIKMVAEELQNEGISLMTTREPGGIDIAEQIREVILNKKNTAMDARTEALLYAAARRQHLCEKVKPALEAGMVVLCDRFIDSSLAYQGHARGLGIDEIYAVNQFAIEDMMPQRTFYFDIEPAEGLKRITQSESREVNRLDLEKLEFHQKVREGYLLLAAKFPERICKIDASQPLEKVLEETKRQLYELIGKKRP